MEAAMAELISGLGLVEHLLIELIVIAILAIHGWKLIQQFWKS
jgi:hypothetical protein